MKEFNDIEEMKKYYDEAKNLFYIRDDIMINFNLKCNWNINAWNINAKNIDAGNINAWNIKANNIDAWDIDAWDISYYAVCFAYNDIICESIQGRRENSRHFVLDGELVRVSC